MTITQRDPSGDADWWGVDASGRRVNVDAFGSSGPGGQFSPPSRTSIINHATKADVIIVDWNEIPVASRPQMEAAIEELKRFAASRGRTIEVVEIPRT